MEKKYLILLKKTELDAAETASKKVVHKTAVGTEDFIGNKIAEKIVLNESKKCWRNSYFARKKTKNIKQIKASIIKCNTMKYLNY